MQFVCGAENKSTCIGALASCGANSCQPESLSDAVALICACTDRMVMKTCTNCPFGGMQLGGSLKDTVIVPIPGVSIVEWLPLQLTISPTTKRIVLPRRSADEFVLVLETKLSLMSVTPEQELSNCV